MLNHPNIPMIYEVIEDGKAYYIVQKYFEGNTLYEVVRKKGRMQENIVIEHGIALTCILEYLHFENSCLVAHLDIQPKNIIVWGKELYLIDFGNGYLNNMKRKNIFGTKGFVAPELYGDDLKKEKIDGAKADLYSLGSVLLYLLTGKTVLDASVSELLDRVHAVAGLKNIIESALNIEMASRQSNISVMKEQLLALKAEQRIKGR